MHQCPVPVLPFSLFTGKIFFKVLPKTFCGELRGKISLFLCILNLFYVFVWSGAV